MKEKRIMHERFLAPDLGRGFMLLLIVAAHAPLYLFHAELNDATRPFGDHLADHFVNFLGIILVDGRAYPMFAILFGFGLAFMVQRQLKKGTPKEQIKRLLRWRAFYLLLFGFIHLVIIGGMDILAFYGFSILLVSWVLFKSTKTKVRMIFILSIIYFMIIPLVESFKLLNSEGEVMGWLILHIVISTK